MTDEQRAALRSLKEYYCRNLAEDPQDGTSFDCEVLQALDDLASGIAQARKEQRERGVMKALRMANIACINAKNLSPVHAIGYIKTHLDIATHCALNTNDPGRAYIYLVDAAAYALRTAELYFSGTDEN